MEYSWQIKGVEVIASHIHDALGQVRRIQEIILERRSFRGYSGRARMAGAVSALIGAALMRGAWYPADDYWHLAGWCAVLAVALLLNYGALAAWFAFNPEVCRNPVMLLPAVDALPALLMGAFMSAGLVMRGEFDLLFGSWMMFYGLAHVSYRQSLPPANYAVGGFYMICGVVCLLWPGLKFVDPIPMGLVFFSGETLGGYVLLRNNRIRRDEDCEDEVDL